MITKTTATTETSQQQQQQQQQQQLLLREYVTLLCCCTTLFNNTTTLSDNVVWCDFQRLYFAPFGFINIDQNIVLLSDSYLYNKLKHLIVNASQRNISQCVW